MKDRRSVINLFFFVGHFQGTPYFTLPIFIFISIHKSTGIISVLALMFIQPFT